MKRSTIKFSHKGKCIGEVPFNTLKIIKNIRVKTSGFIFAAMQWLEKHIHTAEKIIMAYSGSMPLQHFLKTWFSQNKKHGSKDRRTITHFCYTFFRLGKALPVLAFRERLLVALFLCEDDVEKWKPLFSGEFIHNHSEKTTDRIAFMEKKYPGFCLKNIFPFEGEMSFADPHFARSFFRQPKTFLRIRPGRTTYVTSALKKASISFETNGKYIALEPSVNISNVLKLNVNAVVQDLSSQQTGTFMEILPKDNIQAVWDCCAASGGKSILAADMLPGVSLTVSDIRPTILHNLKLRLREARIPLHYAFTADLSKPINIDRKFDLIICDAPCTGSGTWARTPEQLYFFEKEKTDAYATLQKSIISNALPHLKDNGFFLYITCSVFKKENEDMAAFIRHLLPETKIIKQQILKGYANRADTMFAVLVKKEKN